MSERERMKENRTREMEKYERRDDTQKKNERIEEANLQQRRSENGEK